MSTRPEPMKRVTGIPSSSAIGLFSRLATILAFERYRIRSEHVTWSANPRAPIEEHECSTGFYRSCGARISRWGIIIRADDRSFEIAHSWRHFRALSASSEQGDPRRPFLKSKAQERARHFVARNGDFWSIESQTGNLGSTTDIFWHRVTENVLLQFSADVSYTVLG